MPLVVLLKGVNVGRQRRFRPTVLARDLKHLELVNVGSTGAFVALGSTSREQLREAISKKLPFQAEIFICRGREVTSLLSRSHDFFAAHPARPDVVRFVSVLSRAPRDEPELPVRLPSNGEWLVQVVAVRGRFVVGLYRRRMKTIGELRKLEKVFGVSHTTRSWSTMSAIGRVLEGSER